MSQNTRLCMHSCAKDCQRKHLTLNPQIPLAHLEFCCSIGVNLNLRIVLLHWSNMATLEMWKRRRGGNWPKGKCWAILNSSVNWENWKYYLRQYYTDVYRNYCNREKAMTHPKIWSVCVRLCGPAAASWTRTRAKR